MAVLKNIILAASLLAPLALAAPMLDERALHTHTEVVWVTVDETTTVWVDPTAAPTTSTAPAEVVASTTTTTPAPVAVVPTTTESPVEVAVPTTSITSETPAAVFAQTSATPSTFATVAAPVSSEAVASSAPASSSSVVVAVSSTSAAPATQSSTSSTKDVTASASGTCEGEGDACVGDVTHWDGGLGACGWDVDTSSDLQIALPVGFMGSASNSNPYCGRSVTLLNPTTGTTVQAKVGDKCMGCVDRAIDCTDALFTAITDGTGDGRVSGIQWWLN